jgi:hypothetical protein
VFPGFGIHGKPMFRAVDAAQAKARNSRKRLHDRPARPVDGRPIAQHRQPLAPERFAVLAQGPVKPGADGSLCGYFHTFNLKMLSVRAFQF